jgi:hypothetical protein
MNDESRAALRAQLAIARARAESRRPPAEWPPGFAVTRYLILARQAAAGLADARWRMEMNRLRPLVLGPIPVRATGIRRPRTA